MYAAKFAEPNFSPSWDRDQSADVVGAIGSTWQNPPSRLVDKLAWFRSARLVPEQGLSGTQDDAHGVQVAGTVIVAHGTRHLFPRAGPWENFSKQTPEIRILNKVQSSSCICLLDEIS